MRTKLNKSSRGHFKIMSMVDGLEIPQDEGEQIRWCEDIVNNLEVQDVSCIFSHRSTKKGFLVAVYVMGDYYYLVSDIRTEHKNIEVTSIYILDSENDAKAIAKFIADNISTIMQDYSQQLNDAKIGASKYNEIK